MPKYRTINLSLQSQFDFVTLPEYRALPQTYYSSRNIAGPFADFVDNETSTCSVYIPSLPGSQFFIDYSISPPVPDDQLFVFKLFINGSHIVTWSTGKTEDWKGKTMFGLYERSVQNKWKGTVEKRVEKRAMCFTTTDKKGVLENPNASLDDEPHMEIRVHRANGKERIERQVEVYAETQHAQDKRGIGLVNAGRTGSEHPKRFYKFALIDPIDRPFAKFRYYYRPWDSLQHFDSIDEGIPESSLTDIDLSIIEPEEPEDIFRMSPSHASPSPSSRRSPTVSSTSRRSPAIESPASNAQENSGPPTAFGVRGQSPAVDSRASSRQEIIRPPTAFGMRGQSPAARSPSPAPKITPDKTHVDLARGTPGTMISSTNSRSPLPRHKFQDLSLKPLPSPPPRSASSSKAENRPLPAHSPEEILSCPSQMSQTRSTNSNQTSLRRRVFSMSGVVGAITGKWKRKDDKIPPSHAA